MIRQLNEEISVYYEHWSSDKPSGVVLIIHGMAEHILRYDDFANHLASKGFHVYAYDQRGHGQTAGSLENVGFFHEKNGWSRVVHDVKDMIAFIKSEHDLPLYLFGHSMGSFVSRDFASKYSHMIDGLILSGTGYKSGLTAQFMITIGMIESKIKGPRHQSKLIDKITNKVFNAKVKPLETPCDWLSYNKDNVKKYIDDPYCGTVFSSSFYVDLFKAVEYLNKPETVKGMRRDLPIYLFSGDADPVGTYGKGVKSVYDLMGDYQVSMKLYPGRHEMLHEDNRQVVYQDVVTWLEGVKK